MTNQNKVKPDIILKNFWKNNERFADIFNAYLFRGEQIIKAEDLTEADADISSLVKFNEHKEKSAWYDHTYHALKNYYD